MELAVNAMHTTHQIYEIDFRGAQDAGKKIWVAKGIVEWEALLIEDCKKQEM